MAIRINKALALISLISFGAQASPMDWKGSLTVDSHIIRDVRRTGDDCTPGSGSLCITPDNNNARYQSMILKLQPNLVVNDGVTIKGELSTGTGRTAKLGESTDSNTDDGNGSYYTQSTSSNLLVNQMYAEIYADTALYKVGRFSKNWGLGAIVNGGSTATDRFYSGYEGFEATFQLGGFQLTPMWAKLHTSNDPNGEYDSYESSVAALYDNTNRNLKIGLYYSVKEVETQSTLYGSNKGPHNVTLIDLYFSKIWGDFSFELEVPMLSGEVGTLYTSEEADFSANAYIIETGYQANSKWKLGLNGGVVSGDDASSSSFEGMYLNPNYKHSYLLFKYNYAGFMDGSKDVFNASIVNATYAQLYAHYTLDEWSWKFAALWAKANEVAKSGDSFYSHEDMATYTASADQSDDLGTELSIAFDYRWNPNVTFSSYLAYHMVGSYYAFSNSSEDLSTTNVMATGMQLSIQF